MIDASACLSALFTASVGMASQYDWPRDPHSGRSLSCHRSLRPAAFRQAAAEGCAHRWLPCGTRLLVQDLRTGRAAACTVVDRGPYGAMHRGRWVLKRTAREPGRWRGILDVLTPVARRLRLQGLDPIMMWVVPPRTAKKSEPRS